MDELLADYFARGGTITRVKAGKRSYSRAYVREVTGDDDARATADAREAYRKERKLERRKARAAKRKARECAA